MPWPSKTSSLFRVESQQTHRDPSCRTCPFLKTYEGYVILLAEMEMLARGEVFVGTLSSNIGRMALLMREARGRSRTTTLSLDGSYTPYV